MKKEAVHKFGKKRNLIGIYSTGTKSVEAAVLILNSGLVHRAGPFRINTGLAQYLATAGYNVFRFDLSGVGDSEVIANDGRPYKERFIDDIGEAIEFLDQKYHIKKLVVLGLCTGADLAHIATMKYPQVVGCVLLDGYGYPTKRFLINRYGPVLFSFKRLSKAIYNLGKRLFTLGNNAGEKGIDDYFWELPKKSDYLLQMNELHTRGVKQLYVYTGGVKDYYNYKNQFYDCFAGLPFLQDVTVEYMEEADHTFIVLECRDRLFTKIRNWITENITLSFT